MPNLPDPALVAESKRRALSTCYAFDRQKFSEAEWVKVEGLLNRYGNELVRELGKAGLLRGME